MEPLATAISTSCPAAFGGTSGSIFLNALTAVVAAHCAAFDTAWPPDRAEDIIRSAADGLTYDFIVIGAGTAGSVVASRLSNIYRHSSVLLVEAGDDPGIDSEIPAFLFLNQQSKNDWSYKTEPDGKTCLGFKNNSCIWSKGKGMGGSSSINAMLYIRGHPEDFDDWNNQGSTDWSYDDMKKFFDQQEERFNISELPRATHDGWYAIIDEAWKQLGFTSHNYNSNEGITGTKKCTLLIKNGKRLNTAKIVLEEATNLHVMKSAMVQNIIVDNRSKRANGIKIKHSSGRVLEIMANKEVILSAGSIASPHLLMLSGIGPKAHLEDIGIECQLDLPVGRNLQDHLIFPLLLKTNLGVTISSQMINLIILEYLSIKAGPISKLGVTDLFGFINTKGSLGRPNIQFHHIFYSSKDTMILRQYLGAQGYNPEIVDELLAQNDNHSILGIYPTLLHPKSRGEILLNDSNSESKPIIKTNYLMHPDDMKTLIEAIEFVHKLEQTEMFKSLDLKILDINLPGCSSYIFNTMPYWDCYIRHMATTVYHPVGTVKMGTDDMSVVNHELLVHGIDNLRVVDASIMPSIPGANTMAPTLAIAHKAVDLITKRYNYKDEL